MMDCVTVLQVVVCSLTVSCITCHCLIGIYLMHGGNCYSNGSYFYDNDIKNEALICGLPESDFLIDSEWIGPNGTVPCPGSNANLECDEVESTDTSISVGIPNIPNEDLDTSGDGWYKCCLPTNCSDHNTNIIFANIFSKRRL